ncbi:hypothetical protein OH407_24335, partial [Salmonella enterica]|uniref:hypothetical protein n=1 Tax=Salmonella enterica TaxID=28901 RepID=UPI0022B73F87
LLLQALSALNGFTWYLSLPHTLVAANNAIYQSASSVVFLLSIPVLGERVRWHKVTAVIVCITGVALVSFAPASASAAASSVQETPAG